MKYFFALLAVVFILIALFVSLFAAVSFLFFSVLIALLFSPFVLSGQLSDYEYERDNAIGDWPTITDLDTYDEP